MSNQIIKRINDANQLRNSIKTEQISSPNNEAYTKWHEEWVKKMSAKGGYIPPNKDFSEEIFCRDD